MSYAVFPTKLPILDTFKRAKENPLSNGGKWLEIAGESTGIIENFDGEYWQPSYEYSEARWYQLFTRPAVSVEITEFPENYLGVWACLKANIQSGYRVTATSIGGFNEGVANVTIERWVNGSKTVLANALATFQVGDAVGITVWDHVVRGWHQHEGVWVELASAEDDTFSEGYSGIFAKGFSGITLNNFGAIASQESFTEKLLSRVAPWNTGPTENGLTDLERYLVAAAKPFEQVQEAAQEYGAQGEPNWVPAWSTLLNPETCPYRFLPYLAMFVGVSIPITASESEARELVKNEAGFTRGTTSAIETAIRRALEKAPCATLRDALQRSENPLETGWAKPSWAKDTGKVEATGWKPKTASEISAAYYSKETFTEPTVSINPVTSSTTASRFMAIWACLNTNESGYRLKYEGNTKTIKLEKAVEASFSVLAEHTGLISKFAITVKSGFVTGWTQPLGGEWEPTLRVKDSTFTSGYAGIEATAEGNKLKSFHASSGTTPQFSILERIGPDAEEDAYYFIVLVSFGGNTIEVHNEINAAKPGGVLYEVTEVENAWIEGTRTWEHAEGDWTEAVEGKY